MEFSFFFFSSSFSLQGTGLRAHTTKPTQLCLACFVLVLVLFSGWDQGVA